MLVGVVWKNKYSNRMNTSCVHGQRKNASNQPVHKRTSRRVYYSWYQIQRDTGNCQRIEQKVRRATGASTCREITYVVHCIVRWLVNVNWKGFERNRSWFNHGTHPAFALTDWEKTWKFSVRTAYIPTQNRTYHLPNTSLDCYRNTNLLDESK
jgi:hypothetical protein